MIQIFDFWIVLLLMSLHLPAYSGMTKREMALYKERARAMFYHGYNSYLMYAYPYDELKPLSCSGHDTWGSYRLTLVDALDTLLIMGNKTEFARVAKLLEGSLSFDKDINVSVFETNIRVVGGLLSSHLLSYRGGIELEPGWPCRGPLLKLAKEAAEKLLPAFDTKTGMPFGTVNLANGVPEGETTVTCTASIGTFILEFATLTYLTGDKRFENVALRALEGLWNHRSKKGLLGNHIDIISGKWTAADSGIGAGMDSYFEYLVKGGIMFSKPRLLAMFKDLNKKIHQYMKFDDWYVWVQMEKAGITLPFFQSLDAYWPGLQTLLGHIGEASRTLYKYHKVWRQLGFTPEFYQIGPGQPLTGREGYPLRPELIESTMYLYQATKDPFYLEVGRDVLESIERHALAPCGYATIRNVVTHEKEDRMESFFLAETTKYLYLLFDENNFIHKYGELSPNFYVPVPSMCMIGASGYIFNTEAHPLDVNAVHCCRNFNHLTGDFEFNDSISITNFAERKRFITPDKGNTLTGKFKCRARPFHQRLFKVDAFLEDRDDLFQEYPFQPLT